MPGVRGRSGDVSGFNAFRQALRVVEFLELFLSRADAKAELAKRFTLEIPLVRPCIRVAFVEPYLQYLFAVLRDEIGFGSLRVLGAAEKSVTCGLIESDEPVSAFFWNLTEFLDTTLKFAAHKVDVREH